MINAEVEKSVAAHRSRKRMTLRGLDAVIAGRRAQVTSISDDQQRVRENMKALKGSAEEKALVERYVRELNEQEDRVQSLRHEITEPATEARRGAECAERNDRSAADGGDAVRKLLIVDF